jgi:uncharacterized protein with GYD domain
MLHGVVEYQTPTVVNTRRAKWKTGRKEMRKLAFATTILALGLSGTALAQSPQSGSHLYMVQFKISPESIKAALENPQDRTGPNQKLLEGFGGKLIAYYVYPPGEYDGMTIIEVPDEDTARAVALYVQSTGAVSKLNVVPLITAAEWKTVMEKAKQTKTSYTTPTQTKQ